MSFVSIAGNKNYINIMSDGRAVFNDGTIQNDWEKYRIIGGNRFIAFAGTVHSCFSVVDIAINKQHLSYELWTTEVRRATKSIAYSDSMSKAMICIGGCDEGILKIDTFSNKPEHEDTSIILSNTDIAYVFLHNIENELNLENEFMQMAMRYGSFEASDILLAQRDLNNLVSDVNPSMVNKNVSSITLKVY